MVSSSGEEELLAVYLQDLDDTRKHNFFSKLDLEKLGSVILTSGAWKEFANSNLRKTQIESE
jgi:hypothetical protein